MSLSIVGSPQAIAKLSINPDAKPRDSKKRSLMYLAELQTELAAEALNPSEQAGVKALCARAWKDLEELRREILGMGRPKPVEARNTSTKSRRKGSSFVPVPVVASEPPALSSTVPVPVPEQTTS
jgi:hypothetical protein